MELFVRPGRRVLGGLLVAGACLGCADGTAPNGLAGDLAVNRARWAQLGITDYTYRLTVSCFCAVSPPDVTVTVRNGSITAVRDHQSGEAVDPSRHHLYYTVEGLFDEAQGALDAGADRVDVQFHSQLHYPALVDIDRLRNAIDDELRIDASGLARN